MPLPGPPTPAVADTEEPVFVVDEADELEAVTEGGTRLPLAASVGKSAVVIDSF